jgi:spore coat polysaccharide biosynthesis protein SpsF
MMNQNSKKAAIIQARMSSSRLPGKIMADINGKPMVRRVVERARQSRMIDSVVVATSDHPDDDILTDYCSRSGIPCLRGNLNDVLDRYYSAACSIGADILIRLTADCPLLDPTIIDRVIGVFCEGDFDYVSNTLECTYPDGLDTEVFSFAVLERAWREARLKSEREHVTSYIYKHPEVFRCGGVKHAEDLSAMRWTVDRPEDLMFVRAVYAHFGTSDFGMTETVEFLKTAPHLSRINAHIQRNEGYRKSLQEDVLVNK